VPDHASRGQVSRPASARHPSRGNHCRRDHRWIRQPVKRDGWQWARV